MTRAPTEGWVRRPHGYLHHYAGLVGPAGATAARVMAGDRPGERVAALRTAVRDRRDPRRATQRGLVVGPGGRLRWRNVAAPRAPGPGGAVVHPIAVATCDMDRPIMLGATPFALPLHLGHECVAEVVAVGDDVRTVEVGRRVVVPFQISCGLCGACRRGHSGSCTTAPALSMYGFGLAGGPWGGAIADLVAVPYADAMLVPIPDHIDAVAAASVADNISDAYRHIGPHLPGLLRADPSTRVLILGSLRGRSGYTGSVPLYAGLIAVALGARHVDVVDRRVEVSTLAGRLGLRAVPVGDLPDIESAALVVDATGEAPGLTVALRHCAPDGICSSIGGLHRRVTIPQLESYMRNITIHIGRTHSRAVIPRVLELMGDGRLRPEAVTTQVAPVDDALVALDEHCRAGAVKTILTAT